MQKYIKYIAAGGIIVFFVILAIYTKNKMPNNNPASNDNQKDAGTITNLENTSTEKSVPAAPIVKKPMTTSTKVVELKKPTVSKSAPQSYVDAAAKYKKSGYYIQFYPCQATPGSLIMKQGSKIMLDNRDSKAHSIGIKNDKYLIASYNYAIATLNNIGTNYITCDGGGSATVTVVP